MTRIRGQNRLVLFLFCFTITGTHGLEPFSLLHVKTGNELSAVLASWANMSASEQPRDDTRTVLLEPAGSVLSLKNVSLPTGQQYAGGLLRVTSSDTSTVHTMSGNFSNLILDLDNRGTIGLLLGSARVELSNLTLVNVCAQPTDYPIFPTYITTPGWVLTRPAQPGESQNSLVYKNVTMYSSLSESSRLLMVAIIQLSPFAEIANLFARFFSSYSNLNFRCLTVTMGGYEGVNAYFPTTTYLNFTVRDVSDPGDPLLNYLRSRDIISPWRYCNNGSLVSPEVKAIEERGEPFTAPLYRANDSASLVQALRRATSDEIYRRPYPALPAVVLPMSNTRYTLSMKALGAEPVKIRNVTLIAGPPTTESHSTRPLIDLNQENGVFEIHAGASILLQRLVLVGVNLRNDLFRAPGTDPPPTKSGANIDAFPFTAFSTVGNVTGSNNILAGGKGMAGNASSNGSVSVGAGDLTVGYPIRLHDVCLLIIRQHTYLALVYFALQQNPGVLNIPMPCLNASAELIKKQFDAQLTLEGLHVHEEGIQHGFTVDYAAGYGIGATQLCMQPDLSTFGTDYLDQVSGRACGNAAGRSHRLVSIVVPIIAGAVAIVMTGAVVAAVYIRRRQRMTQEGCQADDSSAVAAPHHLRKQACVGLDPAAMLTGSCHDDAGNYTTVNSCGSSITVPSHDVVFVAPPNVKSLHSVVCSQENCQLSVYFQCQPARVISSVMHGRNVWISQCAPDDTQREQHRTDEDHGHAYIHTDVMVSSTQDSSHEASHDNPLHAGQGSSSPNVGVSDVTPSAPGCPTCPSAHSVPHGGIFTIVGSNVSSVPSSRDDMHKVVLQLAPDFASHQGTGGGQHSEQSTTACPAAALHTMRTMLAQQLAGRNDADQVVLYKQLSQGTFGNVWQGTWRGIPVAVKMVLFEVPQAPGCNVQHILETACAPQLDEAMLKQPGMQGLLASVCAVREAAIASSLSHRNIAAVYCVHIEPVSDSNVSMPGGLSNPASGQHGMHVEDLSMKGSQHTVQAYRLVLVQELCASDLSKVLQAAVLDCEGTVDHVAVLAVLRDISHGLKYLHTRPKAIIHGDLKPQNILLIEDSKSSCGVAAKLTDFNLSFHMRVGMSHLSGIRSGSPFYVAPETVSNGHMSLASDIFSLGVIIWEIYSGCRPYVDDGVESQWHPHFGTSNMCPHRTPSPAILDIMRRCLKHDPKQRPGIKEICTVFERELERAAAVQCTRV